MQTGSRFSSGGIQRLPNDAVYRLSLTVIAAVRWDWPHVCRADCVQTVVVVRLWCTHSSRHCDTVLRRRSVRALCVRARHCTLKGHVAHLQPYLTCVYDAEPLGPQPVSHTLSTALSDARTHNSLAYTIHARSIEQLYLYAHFHAVTAMR